MPYEQAAARLHSGAGLTESTVKLSRTSTREMCAARAQSWRTCAFDINEAKKRAISTLASFRYLHAHVPTYSVHSAHRITSQTQYPALAKQGSARSLHYLFKTISGHSLTRYI